MVQSRPENLSGWEYRSQSKGRNLRNWWVICEGPRVQTGKPRVCTFQRPGEMETAFFPVSLFSAKAPDGLVPALTEGGSPPLSSLVRIPDF